MKMVEYSFPSSFENLPPVMVLEYEGKYYSFGRTCRTAHSVWEEVKDNLDTLTGCQFTEEDILCLAQYRVSE